MIDGDTGAESAAVETPETSDYQLYSESTDAKAPEPAADETPEAKLPESKPEAKADDEPDGESGKPPKKLGGYQRKAERLAAENEALRKQLAERTQPAAPTTPADTAGDDGRPNPNDPKYQTETGPLDFAADTAEWRVEQKLNAKEKAAVEAREAADFDERLEAVAEREEAFVKDVPDYHEKIDQAVALGLLSTDTMKMIVKNSDAAEKVAYHLATHPQDLLIMKGLDANGQKAAIVLIEGSLESTGKTETAVRQTRAAAPISPVNTGAKTQNKAVGDEPYEEWLQKRNAELRR